MGEERWAETDARARAVLLEHGGLARMGVFLEGGLTRHQVAALYRRGVLDRPRNAWYCDPGLPWRAKRALCVGGVLACVSAVDSFGLPVPPAARDRTHVQMPGNAPRVRHNRDKRHYVVPEEDREVRKHWSHLDLHPSGWRTDLIEALIRSADCVPEDWWIASLDAARHAPRDGEPLLSDADWNRLIELLPERLRPALALVDPRSESCLETLLRLELLRRGIPIVDLQFWPNRRFRVDILLPGRLIVEADGESTHDPAADAVRDAVLRGLGYRVLRFGYREIVEDIDGVMARIEAALALA